MIFSRFTASLLAAAVVAGVLAWWGWDKAWDKAAEVVSLKAEIRALHDQAEVTDQAMRERDRIIQGFQAAAMDARIKLREVQGDACTDADVSTDVDCLLKQANPTSQRGHASKACADMEREDKP